MKFLNNVYFTLDTIDNYYNLPSYFVSSFEQFFSTFHAFNVREDDKYIRYEVNATIDRDNELNKYSFFLVYNKYDDYYVLLNRNKCTILYVQDDEGNSIIESELINLLLVQLFGYIPRFFFNEDENKVYSKITKYLNNRIQRYIKKYNNPITEYIGNDECGDQYQVLYKGEMIPEYVYENIINYNIIKYVERLSRKPFTYQDKVYTYKNPMLQINFYNVFCKRNLPKTSIKIENIQYLN